MNNPNVYRRAIPEIRKNELISLDDFNFSDIAWAPPNSNDKRMEEAVVELRIGDKKYCCQLKRWTGYVTQEIIFELFKDANLKDYLLQGLIRLSKDTESANPEAGVSIERNPANKKNKSVLPVGTGIVFYKKMLDYIEDQSGRYTHGLLHKVVHDPKLGLTPEKWSQTFEAVLKERAYQKIQEGRWQRLYDKKPEVEV